MPLFTQIQRIKQKIQALNVLRAGKGKTLYHLRPVLTEDELATFEAQHGVSLPTEYRYFLLNVGNGNAETWHRGIRPLQEASKIHHLDSEDLDLKTPFPFDAEMGEEMIKAELYEGVYFTQKAHDIIKASGMVDVTGCLILNYEGWGSSNIALVVSGA